MTQENHSDSEDDDGALHTSEDDDLEGDEVLTFINSPAVLAGVPHHRRTPATTACSLRHVTLSNSEAEFVPASQAGQEVVYLRALLRGFVLRGFGYPQTGAIEIWEGKIMLHAQ